MTDTDANELENPIDVLEEAEPEPEIEYPKDSRLYWIADASKWVSWLILVVSAVYIILRTFYDFALNPTVFDTYTTIQYVVYQVLNLGNALFSFLVLQAIYEGIYLIMDIREMIDSEQVQTQPAQE